MKPHSVLDEAKAIIGERGRDYGDIENNFSNIADLFNLSSADGVEIHPYDVAMLMVCLKLARIKQSPKKRDSYLDLIAYASFACELAGAE
jgi:hypothetical protein